MSITGTSSTGDARRAKFAAAAAILTAALSCAPRAFAQPAWDVNVSMFGGFTTSSKLFLHPDADDEFLRSEYSPVNSVFSFGAEIRAASGATGLHFGLGAEYIRKSVVSSVPNTSESITVEDGYFAVPVELTGYFFIPIGGERIRLYMGGGGGVYFGERIYSYAGARAATVEQNINFGIHVLTGFLYSIPSISPGLAVRTDIKFRNITLESVQQFSQPSALWEGQFVPLPREPLPSRIQIDGMQISVGVAYTVF